jgi:hypothetical protein
MAARHFLHELPNATGHLPSFAGLYRVKRTDFTNGSGIA